MQQWLQTLNTHKRQKLTKAEVPLLNALDCWMSFCILVLVAGTALYVEPVSKGPVLSAQQAVCQDSSRSRCNVRSSLAMQIWRRARCFASSQGATVDFVNAFSMAIMVLGRNYSGTSAFCGDQSVKYWSRQWVGLGCHLHCHRPHDSHSFVSLGDQSGNGQRWGLRHLQPQEAWMTCNVLAGRFRSPYFGARCVTNRVELDSAPYSL